MDKSAKANVNPIRQRTQYTCMTTSVSMCLKALNQPHADEETVNRVLGALPMRGACWEQALAACNHYGMRSTLIVPATLPQLKQYTDQGFPIIIAYNPEGKEWSHASVIFDIEDDLTVHIADPNIADPDETVRIMSKSDFYKVWGEPYNGYTIRRPAMVVQPEISKEGRQLLAKHFNKSASKESKPMSKNASDLAKLSEELTLLSEQMIMGKRKGKKPQPTTKKEKKKLKGKPPKQRDEAARFLAENRSRGLGSGSHRNKEDYYRGKKRNPKHKGRKQERQYSLQQPLQTRPDYGVRNAELEEETMKMSELDMLAMELEARILSKEGPDGEKRTEKEVQESIDDHFPNGAPDINKVRENSKEKKSEEFVSEQEVDAVEEALMSMMEQSELEKFAHLSQKVENSLEKLELLKKASTRENNNELEKTAASGLYGFTKGVQKDCESAIRKVSKTAARIAKQLWAKDQGVCAFLNTHAKRSKSLPAKVILTAMKELGPKVATFHQLRRATYSPQVQPIEKMAGKSGYGMYGFKSKTAQLGVSACSQLKAEVGEIASDLHKRRTAKRENIVGFLSDHKKLGKCIYSKLILSTYPDENTKFASNEFVPDTVQGWIEWEN